MAKTTKKKSTKVLGSKASGTPKAKPLSAAKSETLESKSFNVPKAKPIGTSVEEKKTSKRKLVIAILTGQRVITENSDEAKEFYHQSRFGIITDSGKVELSLLEALYLMEKGRLKIKTEAGREIKFESYIKRARKVEPNFWIRYIVFKDMRNRGYIIKTALKFGADFRVYDRGIKPGEDHAKWIVFPVDEGSTLTWHDFSAKNRVAHSTKKRLLLAIVDAENDVTYYETRWMRP